VLGRMTRVSRALIALDLSNSIAIRVMPGSP
jgi:hypothetical protein